MSGIYCPFCNQNFFKEEKTFQEHTIGFSGILNSRILSSEFNKEAIKLEFSFCPSCSKTQIKIIGFGNDVQHIKQTIFPINNTKIFPDYIPQQISIDYNEACSIVELSPKASATLSRRCLQGMIRDFWGVSGKKNLFEEINAIENQISPQVKSVLNSVRKIGNIGAHMEKDINLIVDIEPGDAKQLINLIEYLIKEWYIDRNDTNKMLDSITIINNSKQEQRKS